MQSSHKYDYMPAGGIAAEMFSAVSTADSVALLYWDAATLNTGSTAVFGTNYGFYDLEPATISGVTENTPMMAMSLMSLMSATPVTANSV
jgi:hypothetical protein